MFFNNRQFDNYWFRTGTPTFLMELLKSRNQIKPVLEPMKIGATVFDGYDPANLNEISLLFQTGYLTINEISYLLINRCFSCERPIHALFHFFRSQAVTKKEH
jgi:hypothetical protein